jgi:F0F1-type ATP synthase membrane subunit b/b'
VLLSVALGILIWVLFSFAVAPFIGAAMRRCDIAERLNSVEVLRAKAQHPASRAA